MTVKTVQAVAQRFLTSDRAAVLALKGAWGVGKTFAWGKLIEENKDKLLPAKYAYVSLFGIAALSELRVAIFANTRAARDIGRDFEDITDIEAVPGLTSRALKSVGRMLFNKDAPYLKQVSIAFDAIAP